MLDGAGVTDVEDRESIVQLAAYWLVSYPDPDSQQLRMDYITATRKVS